MIVLIHELLIGVCNIFIAAVEPHTCCDKLTTLKHRKFVICYTALVLHVWMYRMSYVHHSSMHVIYLVLRWHRTLVF